MHRKIFLVGFLLLLLGAANAVRLTGDFSLETDCVVPAKATYTLYNDSSATHTYSIRATGENREWISMNGVWIGQETLNVTLRSRESEELYAFVKPQTCYVEPGGYSITIEARNDEDITKTIAVTVLESRAVELNIIPRTMETSQCEAREFDIKIRNLGDRSERVILSVEGLPSDWTSLSNSEVLLSGGETRTVELGVKPDCDAETKEYRFTVRGDLKGTSFFVEEDATFAIEDRQGLKITHGTLNACLEKIASAEVTIKNEGLLSDSLSLSIEGLPWASIEPRTITLDAGQSKDVLLVFSKTTDPVGEYDFTFVAHSTKFNKDTEKGMTVKLQDCYSIIVESVEFNGREAEEKPEACIESSPVYTFVLKNDAVETVEAEARITGIDSVISPATLEIKAGETVELKVEIDLENESAGEKRFSLQIKGDEVSIQYDYEFIAVDCFGLEVEWNGLAEAINLDANGQSEAFTITVRNIGEKGQGMKVKVEGPEWIFFEPETASLESGGEKEFFFFFSPPYDIEEGRHYATVTVEGEEKNYARRVEMNVYGGLYADSGTATVEAKIQVDEVVEKLDRSVKISLLLSNTSDTAMRVDSIAAKGFEATFDFKPRVLLPGEETIVPMQLKLRPKDGNRFAVGLIIETDRGTMEKAITVDLAAKEEEEEPEPIPVGLFGLAGLGDILLAAIVIAVIAIFAAIALSAEVKVGRKQSGLAHLAKEVQEIPGKKLEEIGKRKRGRPSSRNLQDIVKEVKRKHRAKPVRKRKK